VGLHAKKRGQSPQQRRLEIAKLRRNGRRTTRTRTAGGTGGTGTRGTRGTGTRGTERRTRGTRGTRRGRRRGKGTGDTESVQGHGKTLPRRRMLERTSRWARTMAAITCLQGASGRQAGTTATNVPQPRQTKQGQRRPEGEYSFTPCPTRQGRHGHGRASPPEFCFPEPLPRTGWKPAETWKAAPWQHLLKRVPRGKTP
jgi:hypothetical protein